MKKSRMFLLTSFMLVMVMVLSACGSKSSSSDNMTDTVGVASSTSAEAPNIGKADSLTTSYDSDQSMEDGSTAPASNVAGSAGQETKGIENTAALSTEADQVSSQDKIIKNYNLTVETQDFDQLIKDINDQIKSLGGYVESSSINGKSYYESNVTRNGNIVARIPSKKADDFVNAVDKKANVTNNQSSTENVTLQYVDMQSRIEALKTEEDRLFAILEKAEDLESVITLESRLSDIRYELQNYKSQLRVFDNQVEYSTITLNIDEVKRITSDSKDKPTFTSRIKNGFGDTLYHIGEGFQNFTVWFIVNLPYLFLWAIVIFIIVLITRRVLKKMEKNKGNVPHAYNYMQNNTMPQDGKPLESKNPNDSEIK